MVKVDVSNYSYDQASIYMRQNEINPQYDAVTRYSTIKYFGNDLKGSSVIDSGCGRGDFLQKCSSLGATYCLGVDLSQGMIQMAQVTHKNNNNIEFLVGNCFESLDMGSQKFDFAVSHFTICYCQTTKQLELFMKNVYDSLKIGGKVYFVTAPNMSYDKYHQDVMTKAYGFMHPLRPDDKVEPQGPNCGEIIKYRGVAAGDGCVIFTNEVEFVLRNYYWSPAQIKEAMRVAGFGNVERVWPQVDKNLCKMEVVEEEVKLKHGEIHLVGEKMQC